MADTVYSCHYEDEALIAASATRVFDWLDDPRHLAAHMNRSSAMMAGGSMALFLDEMQGRQVGSQIRMRGRMLGLLLELDEVVTEREAPIRKVWETVGEPTLWVLSRYRMGVDLKSAANGCYVRVFIDYDLPASPVLSWLARWMSRPYAVWCVEQMLAAVREAFGHVQVSSNPG